MSTFVLITSSKILLKISPQERDMVLQALQNKTAFAVISKQVIPLTIPPTILSHEFWIQQENNRLAEFNKQRCSKCDKIFDKAGRGSRCNCDIRKDENCDPLIPLEIKKRLQERGEIIKSMPEPSYQETLQARAESGDRRAQFLMHRPREGTC